MVSGRAASARGSARPRARDIRLKVDGGIKVDNIRRVAYAGADTLVAGGAIFGQEGHSAVIGAM